MRHNKPMYIGAVVRFECDNGHAGIKDHPMPPLLAVDVVKRLDEYTNKKCSLCKATVRVKRITLL